jgi:hypothetical protein
MSKKRDKKILKYLKRRSAPKRIAGVKIPKSLRHAAKSELGAAIIAGLLVSSAGIALPSGVGVKLRRRAKQIAEKVATAMEASAKAVTSETGEAVALTKRRKPDAEIPLPH